MKIENETLYINKIDLDHILGDFEMEEYLGSPITPPSELFMEGLENELKFAGLDKTLYSKIELNFGWEE